MIREKFKPKGSVYILSKVASPKCLACESESSLVEQRITVMLVLYKSRLRIFKVTDE